MSEKEFLISEEQAHAASINTEAALNLNRAHLELLRPSTLYRPRLSIDGDQWCALYGDNLQDGVAGFGDSPAEAYAAFDAAWVTPLGQMDGAA